MKSIRLFRLFAVCLWICSISPVALGQVTSRVTGVVRDPQGALVSNATVTLTNEDTGVSFTTTTSAGNYVFDAVKPGTYTVRIEAAGFRRFTSSGNVLTVGQPMTVNAQLLLGGLMSK